MVIHQTAYPSDAPDPTNDDDQFTSSGVVYDEVRERRPVVR
jgi:hypothetical protein